MLEKIELRKKLKEISLVNAEYTQIVIDRLQNVIKDKIVCTYIPLETVSYTHLTLPTNREV